MTSGREGSTTSGATTPPHLVLCDPPVTFARAEAPDEGVRRVRFIRRARS